MKEIRIELIKSAPRINYTAKVVTNWKSDKSTHIRAISNITFKDYFEKLNCLKPLCV